MADGRGRQNAPLTRRGFFSLENGFNAPGTLKPTREKVDIHPIGDESMA
jgi:hypothetical protein